LVDLRSAAVPPIGPTDHVRGSGPEAILYLDLGCPRCAAEWPMVKRLGLRLCVRHFPLAAKRPRSLALHAAAEAAALQRADGFWALWDSIYADHGHLDDPHLWERGRRLGLELTRFDADRRSEVVAARVQADFRGGIRAGVAGTPTAFIGGERIAGDLLASLESEVPL